MDGPKDERYVIGPYIRISICVPFNSVRVHRGQEKYVCIGCINILYISSVHYEFMSSCG